ncbi:MAG: ABC transporter substrate-binding protein [Oscillospiraceae bacterium]
MKKWMSLLLALALALSLAACGAAGQEETAEDPATLRVAAIKGPTGMGLVKLMSESDAGSTGTNTYEFTLVASPDEIVAGIGGGELDVACVPANLGATLYNNTDGAVRVLAVNTLGVLYIVENGDTVHSVEDLAGRTIYSSGKGSTTEYALQHILDSYGVEAAVEWKSEHAECVAALAADEQGVALLPQPFASAAQMQNENIRVALDLNELWEELGDGSALITGCVIARTEFVEEHSGAIDLFLQQYADSVDYVNANTDEAAELIEAYDIIQAAVAKKALPFCNIVCIRGQEMKEQLGAYLELLHGQNAKAVGGSLPDEAYYYIGE